MNIDVKNNVENLESTLSISLDKKEFAPFLDEAFKKEVKEVNADGFRKGKMPKAIFIQKYGIESLFNEAINQAVAKTYAEAVIDNNIKGVAFPTIDVVSVSEEGMEYTAVVAVAPSNIEVDETKINVEEVSTEVTSEDIEKEMKELVSSETELVLSDKTAELGDTVVIDFKGFKDGEAFEGGEGLSYPLELGSNSFIPGFEEQLVGSKSGEEVKVNVTFPENYQAENLAGQDVVFECKVHEVKVSEIPELTEEFVKNLGIDNVNTVEELKENKRNEIKKEKEKDLENKLRESALKAVDSFATTLSINIHDKHIEEEINEILKNFENQNQIKLEEYSKMVSKTIEEIREEVKDAAVESIKRRVVLDSIAHNNNIDANDEDVEAEIKKLADMYQVDTEVIKQSVSSELSQIKSMIKDQKVLDKLLK